VRRADLVLHAGDFTSAAFLDELAALCPLHAVHGNVDEPALQRALPERLLVEVEALRIGMVHDAGPRAGRADRLVAAFPGCAAVVYGHTHLPEIAQHDGVWILNPGSPTERRRAPHRSLITLRIQEAAIDPQLVTVAP
jgi:uncharacterized protein